MKKYLCILFLLFSVQCSANVATDIFELKAIQYKQDADRISARFRAWHVLETNGGGNPDIMTPPASIFEGTNADWSYNNGELLVNFVLPERVATRLGEKLPLANIEGGVRIAMTKDGYWTSAAPPEIDTSDFISRTTGGTFDSGANLTITGRLAPSILTARSILLTLPDGSTASLGVNNLLTGTALNNFDATQFYRYTYGTLYGDDTELRGYFSTPFGKNFSIDESSMTADELNVLTMNTPYGTIKHDEMDFRGADFTLREFGNTKSGIRFSEGNIEMFGDEVVFNSLASASENTKIQFDNLRVEAETIDGTITGNPSSTFRIAAPSVEFTGHVYMNDVTVSSPMSAETFDVNRLNIGTAPYISYLYTTDNGTLVLGGPGNVNLDFKTVRINGWKALTEEDIVYWPVPAMPFASEGSAVAVNGESSYSVFYPSTTLHTPPEKITGMVFAVGWNVKLNGSIRNEEVASLIGSDGVQFRNGKIKRRAFCYPAEGADVYIVRTGSTAALYTVNAQRDGFAGRLEELADEMASFESNSFTEDSVQKGEILMDAPVLVVLPETYKIETSSATIRSIVRNNDKNVNLGEVSKSGVKLAFEGAFFSGSESDFVERQKEVGVMTDGPAVLSSVNPLEGVVFTHIDIPRDENGVIIDIFTPLGIPFPTGESGDSYPSPESVVVNTSATDMSKMYTFDFESDYEETLIFKSGRTESSCDVSIPPTGDLFSVDVSTINLGLSHKENASDACSARTYITFANGGDFGKYDMYVVPAAEIYSVGVYGQRVLSESDF